MNVVVISYRTKTVNTYIPLLIIQTMHSQIGDHQKIVSSRLQKNWAIFMVVVPISHIIPKSKHYYCYRGNLPSSS